MKAIFFLSLTIAGTLKVNAQFKKDTSGLKKPVITNIQEPAKPNTQLPVKFSNGIQRSASTTNPPGGPTGTSTNTPHTSTTSTAASNNSSQQAPTTPNSSTPPVKTDADYYLSVVRVTVKTGKDNKEYPSVVSIDVCDASQRLKSFNNNGFRLTGYTNELKTNTTQSLVIEKVYKYSPAENSLERYRQNGIKFLLFYDGYSVFDAWKIESISLTLEFKDEAGNPHPTMGSRVITFSDSDLWMDGFDKRYTYYKTDSYFNPMPVKQIGAMENLYE